MSDFSIVLVRDVEEEVVAEEEVGVAVALEVGVEVGICGKHLGNAPEGSGLSGK
jgi:hypothetical protein